MKMLIDTILFLIVVNCVVTPGNKKIILYDLGHGQLFSPSLKGSMDYSQFINLYIENGCEIKYQKKKITNEALKDVSILILNGVMKELSIDEIQNIITFVHSGGQVLILMHISFPVARLTESMGIIVSNFVVQERDAKNILSSNGSDFLVNNFYSHPILKGIKNISVYGSWGLNAEGMFSKLLASTSKKAFADLNQNNKLDISDPVQSYGIVGLAEIGKGKIIIISDDAIFNNNFISQFENKKFAKNIRDFFIYK